MLMILSLLCLLLHFGDTQPIPQGGGSRGRDINKNLNEIYSREKVPLLHLKKNKRSSNDDDLKLAKISLVEIENLDIKNGILRNLMIKPISAKK